jgi:transposase
MPYICGESREQLTLMPMCLDDYIGEDSICRIIAAYVSRLDMAALGFKYAETKDKGRRPYNPSNMLMLYIYGYLNRIRSSRRLESETRRNVEVMWLMEKLTPDDKTICNFRKDNAVGLRKLFREFSLWCNRQGLYGKELVVVDGTKIRADNSRRNIHSKKNTEIFLANIEKKISEYIKTLDKNDTDGQDEPGLSPKAIREALKRLRERKTEYEGWRDQIAANGGSEIAMVDTDCRMMKQGGNARPLDACYNVQTAVDEKNKLIVDFEVTNCPDEKGALPKMTEKTKELMGVSEIIVLADKGYFDPGDISQCEQNGTTCYVASMISGVRAPNPEFDHEAFCYDKENDCYICPMGQTLQFKRIKAFGKLIGREYHNSAACYSCTNHAKCTKGKRARAIFRNPNQDALDTVNVRMHSDEGRRLYKKRKEIVEHSFGTTKRAWGYGNFLCRGLEKTTGEQSLVFLAYNLRRVFNIFKETGGNLTESIS